MCHGIITIIISYLFLGFFSKTFYWFSECNAIIYLIKFVIGCFEESVVNTLTKKSHEMYFPSAGRCQEVCLASNYSVFGVQVTLSVCQLVFTN